MPIERGTRSFLSGTRLILDFGECEGQPERRTLEINHGDAVIIGRAGKYTGIVPDISLAQLGGWERGVSRLHAVIRRSGDNLFLIDLESTNGTFINGERITAGTLQQLRDGDTISLGMFNVTVHFVRPEAG